MAPLPSCRLNAQRAFAYVGIDFASPFPILFSRGRGAKTTKGYIAIFICMVIKAVHIEAASDLTTEAFLAAYVRFVACRGLWERIYSDNGTTFKGAAALLKKLFIASSPELWQIVEALADHGRQWYFIPPRAPHFERIMGGSGAQI